ncbi:TPA: hypothetical protein KDY87_003969 [Vibrio parahaemolyticus]|nr:hypothetical protein [Vibrio parahaemolyticus]
MYPHTYNNWFVSLQFKVSKTELPQINWFSIKKFEILGLSSISITCAELALVIASPQEPPHQCALWALMFNAVAYSISIICSSFEGQFNEVSRNDKKLYFS